MEFVTVIGKRARKYRDGWRFLDVKEYNNLDKNLKTVFRNCHFVDADFKKGGKSYVLTVEWSNEGELLHFLAKNEWQIKMFDNYGDCVDTNAKYVVIM